MAVGGGSAERRAEELAALGDDAAGTWAAGAAGERRVAEALAELREAWTVLHDRLLRPGRSEANLDHVVIGPGGLFLVDAKNRAGRVTEWEGGLFQHTTKAGQPVSLSLAAELKKVHGMAAYMAVESGLPVTPVLCLAGQHEGEFGEPRMVREIWVVPVSRLVAWLGSQAVVFDRPATERAVTRAMTDFPSTTTDPALLAAIGQAAISAKPRRRAGSRLGRTGAAGPRRGNRARGSGPHKRSVGAKLGRGVAACLLMVIGFGLLYVYVPRLLTSFFEGLAATPGAAASSSTVSPSVARTASKRVNAKGNTALAASPKPSPKAGQKPPSPALALTDCANVTAAEVSSALKRKVQPIATNPSVGCAWGTRLDDPTTTLVTIRMSAGHAAYDPQLETSAKQHRVVYGTGYDARFRPATALWVAAGQPIRAGRSGVWAGADTYVVVASTALGASDDRGRAMALAIAASAYRN